MRVSSLDEAVHAVLTMRGPDEPGEIVFVEADDGGRLHATWAYYHIPIPSNSIQTLGQALPIPERHS
jgi:hypothetical protein